MDFVGVVEGVGRGVDLAGVVVIAGGGLLVCGVFGYRAVRAGGRSVDYRGFRQSLGRAILLGLEILVAGDIIRTVAATPTLNSVAVLAAIVAIRTVLSFSLEVELTGRWPWQGRSRG
ncbi:DUF1622 domain-containing protein [Actinomadura atramentaria]|uniref:DUF1622 domain-containing protein n=1 Tax=Actinomadura atramentaria TaxID=1990 RepID=UPI0004768218|nr:DUF1622 domain-containing protein [Actinomadura atramentaria]